MKILVISDSHGNITNLEHVLGFAKKVNISHIVHAGDWHNIAAIEKVFSFGIPVYSVLGNADIDPLVEENLKLKSKKFGKEYLLENVDGKNIGVTHKPQDIKKNFEHKNVDVIFCGHRHSKDDSMFGDIRVVRPGAIANGINFAVYNTENGFVEFISDD